MLMIMQIDGKPFIEMEIDFSGKDTVQERQQHLEEIAGILEAEYEEAIQLAGPAIFFCSAGSRMQFLELDDFDMKQFDITLKAKRFLNQKTIKTDE